MSRFFTVNQFDSFEPKLLVNWQLGRSHRDRDYPNTGFTNKLPNDRGNLLPHIQRPITKPRPNLEDSWMLTKQVAGGDSADAFGGMRRHLKLASLAKERKYVKSGQDEHRRIRIVSKTSNFAVLPPIKTEGSGPQEGSVRDTYVDQGLNNNTC